ncbi:MAG: hypothetical protein ABIL11_00120 [Chloroflexota bacterium]
MGEADLEALPDDQVRYDQVMARYLGGQNSLERTSQLLHLNFYELRMRLARLGAENMEELREEIRTAREWSEKEWA